MPYAVAPLRDVKGENNWAEYQAVLRNTEARAYAAASRLWPGKTPGGITPGEGQFGNRPLIANAMANDVTATTLSGTYTFRKNHGGTGWRPIFNYTSPDDMVQAFVGFGVEETVFNFNQLRMELGKTLLPILGLQEIRTQDTFDFIIKTDEGKELVVEPRTRVLVRGYFTATGYQTIYPLGFELYRQSDRVITEI